MGTRRSPRIRSCSSSSRAGRRATRSASPGPTTRREAHRRSDDRLMARPGPRSEASAERAHCKKPPIQEIQQDEFETVARRRGGARPWHRERRRDRPGQRRRRDRPLPRDARRTAIRPNWGKRAARNCGRRSAGRRTCRSSSATSGSAPACVKGAYAQMPRYFADADQVMDLESRLVWCMVTQQGMERAAVTKSPFSGAGQRQTDMEALTAYARRESRGIKMNVPQGHPKEKESYDRGAKMFYLRGGPHDFSCATCHGEDGSASGCRTCPTSPATRPSRPRLHDLAGVPRVAGRAAHDPVAPERLLPAAALPRPGLRVADLGRADHVPWRERQRRQVRRAGDQALRRTGMKWQALSIVGVGGRRRLRELRRPDQGRSDAGDQELVQGARHREARPPRPDEMQAVCSDAQRAGKEVSKDATRGAREEGPRHGQVSGRRQISRRLEDRASASRRRASACNGATPRRRSRRQLLRVPPDRAAGNLVRHHRSVAAVRQGARLRRAGRQVHVRQDLEHPRLQRCARTCRASAMPDPDRGADQGRDGAAAGSRFAGQQVAHLRGRRWWPRAIRCNDVPFSLRSPPRC